MQGTGVRRQREANTEDCGTVACRRSGWRRGRDGRSSPGGLGLRERKPSSSQLSRPLATLATLATLHCPLTVRHITLLQTINLYMHLPPPTRSGVPLRLSTPRSSSSPPATSPSQPCLWWVSSVQRCGQEAGLELTPEHKLEQILPRFRHVDEAPVLCIEMSAIEHEMREMCELEGICRCTRESQRVEEGVEGDGRWAMGNGRRKDQPVSLSSFPTRLGVPTAMQTFRLRYSTCSLSLKCFAKSLATSMSFVL
jgi:hypothetical protein